MKKKLPNEKRDSQIDWETNKKVEKYMSSAKDIKKEDFEEIKV